MGKLLFFSCHESCQLADGLYLHRQPQTPDVLADASRIVDELGGALRTCEANILDKTLT